MEDHDVKFTRPPRTKPQRALARAPIWLYRCGLGALLGHRFLLLTHTGRSSGRPHQVVLEVVGRHEESGGYLVASGYGARSQWFRNILTDPRVGFQVGARHYIGVARPLPAAESGRRLAEYARRHPRTAAALMRGIGQDVDGSAADYERVGSDREHGIPLVELRPDTTTSPPLSEQIRPGVVGGWGRLVGPGASMAENAGTLALGAAGVLCGAADTPRSTPPGYRVSMRLLAFDLWGGAWANNTPSCVAWYGRPGQGPRQHVEFAAVHLAHAALIARVGHLGGRRSAASATRWAIGHYALMIGSAAIVTRAPRRARLPIAVVSTAAGLVADHLLGRSTVAPWFAPCTTRSC